MAENALTPAAASGLGTPLVRNTLVFSMVVLTVNGVLTGFLSLADPASVLTYVVAFGAVFLVTAQHDQPLPPEQTAVVLAVSLIAAAVSLWTEPSESRTALFWFAPSLVGLLAVRGNLVGAATGACAHPILNLVWAHWADVGLLLAAVRAFIPLLGILPGFIVYFAFRRIARNELRHRLESARAMAAREAAKQAAARASADLRVIREEAMPLLSVLHDGGPIDSSTRQALSVLEATIRDRIAAPRLNHPRLREAIRGARERGVFVRVLGEATDERPAFTSPLVDVVAQLLDGVADGEVTLRVLSAQQETVLTILTSASSGESFLALDGAGISVERR